MNVTEKEKKKKIRMNKAEENNLSSDFRALTFKTFSNLFWPKSGGQNKPERGNIVNVYGLCDALIPLYLSLAHEHTIFVLDV